MSTEETSNGGFLRSLTATDILVGMVAIGAAGNATKTSLGQVVGFVFCTTALYFLGTSAVNEFKRQS